MADDDVQLTDLEVIQQFSLAVRGATASRADVIAALEADLAYLGGGRKAKVSVEKTEAAVKAAPSDKAATSRRTAVKAAPKRRA